MPAGTWSHRYRYGREKRGHGAAAGVGGWENCGDILQRICVAHTNRIIINTNVTYDEEGRGRAEPAGSAHGNHGSSSGSRGSWVDLNRLFHEGTLSRLTPWPRVSPNWADTPTSLIPDLHH